MTIAATPQGTQLTERQARFLALAEEGLNHRQIAEECGVAIGTVSSTISHIRNRALSIAGERELTARQLEVLALVGAGYTDPEIGSELFMARRTVENHIRDARERLGARNRFNAAMIAVARELLILDHDGQLFVPSAYQAAA